ncbi:hypothetical protein niasHS_015070 [Heterodera schachtii]|uniref:Major facilitator superfamily (MFS) profile domain-containing protein n=1 Tax=Heterodera schachtii TaxID=97005 RepID=A0ABD2I8R3_HETSC
MSPNFKSVPSPTTTFYGSLDQPNCRSCRSTLPPVTFAGPMPFFANLPIAPLVKERTKVQCTAWPSIYLCALFTFVASVQFTLLTASMWPYLMTLDTSLSEGFLGLLIALFSLSLIVASALFGVWSNRIRRFKPPLIFCNFCLFCGNFLYFTVSLFPSHWIRFVLIASRIAAGIGLAQIGLLKSYGISLTVPSDRQRATAFITGGSAMGTIFGPLLQLLFTSIESNRWSVRFAIDKFSVRLSLFTAPPLFASFVSVLLLLILLFCFSDSFVDVMRVADLDRVVTVYYQYSRKRLSRVSYDASPLPICDQWAASACYAMRFTQCFVLTSMEAISAPFAMLMFNWSYVEVVFNESVVNALFGGIALATYASYFVFDLGKRISGRFVCLCVLFALLFFYCFTFSWSFLSTNVSIADENSGEIAVGCDSTRLGWCRGLKRINIWLYYALVVGLQGFAFPTLNVKLNTLFSQIVGPRLQSKQQCFIEMFGGIGRILGPLLTGSELLDF